MPFCSLAYFVSISPRNIDAGCLDETIEADARP